MYCYCKDWYNVPPISHFVPLYRWLVGDGHLPISILVINVQSLTASYQLWKTEKVKVYHHFKRIFTSEKDFTSDLEWETNVLSWSYTTTNIIFKMIIWQEISHLISWWYLQTETYKHCIIKCFGYKIDFSSMKYKSTSYTWHSFIVFKSFK